MKKLLSIIGAVGLTATTAATTVALTPVTQHEEAPKQEIEVDREEATEQEIEVETLWPWQWVKRWVNGRLHWVLYLPWGDYIVGGLA